MAQHFQLDYHQLSLSAAQSQANKDSFNPKFLAALLDIQQKILNAQLVNKAANLYGNSETFAQQIAENVDNLVVG